LLDIPANEESETFTRGARTRAPQVKVSLFQAGPGWRRASSV